MKNFENKLKEVPINPGVYLMKDGDDNIIYVGKAKNLKKRVRQYFQKARNQLPKIEEMKVVLEDFDYIITDTELEALILENKLIKKYKPKYNAMLKNFENYKYIKITDEKFSRVVMETDSGNDGRFYGPFSKTHFVAEAIELLRDIFRIRRCNKDLNSDSLNPCLHYHIKRCIGPCRSDISKTEYNKIIGEIMLLLEGKNEELIKTIENDMINASKNMEFEKAALYRDKISMIKRISFKQRAVTLAMSDNDIIAFLIEEDNIYIFYICNGKILGKLFLKDFNPNHSDINKQIKDFISNHYNGLSQLALTSEVIAKEDIDEAQIIERWLLNENGIYFRIEHIDNIEKTIDLTKDKIIAILEQMN